ncbi:ATP-binding protein [Microcoleus sp. herbarium12]|uniref:ATP-binding protein n=1 Tax=Microcoleus sp. herbarium12 TaxID=3055437 RepID=UPI002FD74B9F
MIDNINEIPSGGIGIKVIGKIADELSYTRTFDQRNCLFIIKYYQQQVIASQPATHSGYFQRPLKVLNKFNWFKNQRIREAASNSDNQPVHEISLQVTTDLKAVTQILYLLEDLERLPIPEVVFHQCKLATIEGFTNAVRHAHKNLPLATPIELSITVFNERIEIKIWDLGEPFDFLAKLAEELSEKSPFSWNGLEVTIH